MRNSRKEMRKLEQNSHLMTRKELILKIISLYPDTFREDRPEHVQSWVEMYERAIKKNWNMEKLMFFFATQYKSTVVPPSPSFFYEYREVVKPEPTAPPIKVRTPEEQKQDEIARKNFIKQMKELQQKLSMPDI